MLLKKIFKRKKKVSNKKKAFTLVELLAIIVILSMVVVIGVPVYQSSSKKSKEKMYRAKLDNANQSGKLWALDNMECFKTDTCTEKIVEVDCTEGFGTNDSCYIISLNTLAKEGYYSYDDDNENIINPIDKSLMNEEQILLVYNEMSKKVSNHPLKSYLYRVVTFDPSTQRNQNKTISINGLYEIDSVKTDNGIISFNRDKDNITLNLTNGDPTSTKWNPTLYNKTATANSTSGSNSFNNTYSYNDGEYTGTLNKNGSSFVISGSYTSEDTKYVSGQTSSYYNSGGYSGSLSSYVYSGSYTPSHSKSESVTLYATYPNTICWIGDCAFGNCLPTSYYYNSGGYSGTLTRPSGAGSITSWETNIYLPPGETPGNELCDHHYSATLTGNVTKPASDTRVYRYEGNVTRPASDTRIWQQDYSGTVYKGGSENLYSYTVTIAYNLKQ